MPLPAVSETPVQPATCPRRLDKLFEILYLLHNRSFTYPPISGNPALFFWASRFQPRAFSL
jgi:hypothetical protein